ncbi:MAG: histidine--tRNA ligase [Bacillota bacterium]
MLTTLPRGTKDILPGEVEKWQYLERVIRDMCGEYGYDEIRTPVFEHTELFLRGVGETTDIVEKEMYTFADRGDRSITLRPEGTAPVVRAFLEHNLQGQGLPAKLFYMGPMFRYGRPQAGRLRQFHQFGTEVFGSREPAVDAEVIGLAMSFCHRLGLKDLILHLNSVGCPACRSIHKQKLQAYLHPHLVELCPTCHGRFERNPLRIFDCKSPRCQELVAQAPDILRSLCPECAVHFRKVQTCLDRIEVKYLVYPRLVRGLDYYTNTAFEIEVAGIGAQSSIGGGGRYDGLVAECGGPPLPGIGFGMGLERILLALEAQGVDLPAASAAGVYIAAIGEGARMETFAMINRLRQEGIRSEMDYMDRSLKAQMKAADRYGARLVVILGDAEIERQVAVVRIMATGEQQEVPLDGLVDFLKDRTPI